MSDYGANIVLPHLVKRLRRSAPGIDLSITQLSREGMIAGVVDGNVDIGLDLFPELPAKILAEHLISDQYACLIDRRSLPSPDRKLELDNYLSRPHVLVAVHGDASTEIDKSIYAAGLSRRVAVVLPHWSVAPTTIVGTDLILTVAARSLEMMRGNKELVVLDSPIELPPTPFLQISHRRRQSDPALRWLRSLIAEIIQPDFLEGKSAHDIAPGTTLPSP